MKLTDRFDDVLVYKNKEIRLGLYFDVVLRSFELLEDKRFSDFQKFDILLDMFVINREVIHEFNRVDKANIVNSIFQDFINDKKEEDEEEIEQEDQHETKEEDQEEKDEKLYDLDKDAEYIYASFLYDYNIDLFEQHGKLHWRKFKKLLSNLSDDSKFKNVLSIRSAKVPAPTKHNKEYRDNLIKQKRMYKLKTTQNVEDVDKRFDQLASSLRPNKK